MGNNTTKMNNDLFNTAISKNIRLLETKLMHYKHETSFLINQPSIRLDNKVYSLMNAICKKSNSTNSFEIIKILHNYGATFNTNTFKIIINKYCLNFNNWESDTYLDILGYIYSNTPTKNLNDIYDNIIYINKNKCNKYVQHIFYVLKQFMTMFDRVHLIKLYDLYKIRYNLCINIIKYNQCFIPYLIEFMRISDSNFFGDNYEIMKLTKNENLIDVLCNGKYYNDHVLELFVLFADNLKLNDLTIVFNNRRLWNNVVKNKSNKTTNDFINMVIKISKNMSHYIDIYYPIIMKTGLPLFLEIIYENNIVVPIDDVIYYITNNPNNDLNQKTVNMLYKIYGNDCYSILSILLDDKIKPNLIKKYNNIFVCFKQTVPLNIDQTNEIIKKAFLNGNNDTVDIFNGSSPS